MDPLGHITTLIFCFVEVIVHVRVVIPGLAHFIFPTWTYCFHRRPLLPVSKPMTSFLKEEAYIVENEGIQEQASVGVNWGTMPSFWIILHLVETN